MIWITSTFSKASAYDKTPFFLFFNVSYAFQMKTMNLFDRCSVNDRREHIKKYVLSKWKAFRRVVLTLCLQGNSFVTVEVLIKCNRF